MGYNSVTYRSWDSQDLVTNRMEPSNDTEDTMNIFLYGSLTFKGKSKGDRRHLQDKRKILIPLMGSFGTLSIRRRRDKKDKQITVLFLPLTGLPSNFLRSLTLLLLRAHFR